MSRRRRAEPSISPSGRVEVVTRPAWRLTAAARAPRALAGLVACVVMVAGVRTIIAGAPEPSPPPPAPAGSDLGAESFAEAFVRAYLTWDADQPERREQALATFG